LPELPDIVVYIEALRSRVVGQPLERIRLRWGKSGAKPPGKLLADRGLSRLLKSDWPRTLKKLESRTRTTKEPS